MNPAVRLRPAGLFALGAIIVALPVLTSAATNFRTMMHAWRDDAHITHDMMVGRTTFDAKTMRRALRTYADDAGRLSQQLNERTADARDFKQRFVAFRTDAQTALADLGERPRLAGDLSRMFSDCQSCHDKFKN